MCLELRHPLNMMMIYTCLWRPNTPFSKAPKNSSNWKRVGCNIQMRCLIQDPISHITQLSAQQSVVQEQSSQINPFLSENDVIKRLRCIIGSHISSSSSGALVLPSTTNDMIKYLVAKLHYLLNMNIKHCPNDQEWYSIRLQNSIYLIDELIWWDWMNYPLYWAGK